MALPSGEERDSLVQGNSQGRIFGIFEEMKRLSKYLFVMLLLPMSGRGQQQVIITKVRDIRLGIIHNREDNIKSAKYYPIQYICPYYFNDSCTTIYKSKHVRKIEAFDTFGKSAFTLFLDKDGTLTSAYAVDRTIAFNEVFEPSFYSRTSAILNTPTKLNDSFVSKIFVYKNEDTTITFYQNTTYTFKTGLEINSRNKCYNSIYMQRENPYVYKTKTRYILDGKMKRLLNVNYEPKKIYKCSEKRYCSWVGITKNKRFYGDITRQELYHPFITKLTFEECVDWFVDGENFDMPIDFELETMKNFPKSFCGGNIVENDRLNAARNQLEYTFEVYSQNESGLNDTAFLYFYPKASKAESVDCFYFIWPDPAKRGGISPDRITEEMRSLIPKRIPLYTIRYEYYKD